MCITCLIPNVYLVYTSHNLFLHFEPVFLVPVQQMQTGCRICNPASPITSRWPADGHTSTVPSSASNAVLRFTCHPSAWETWVSKDSAALRQSRGNFTFAVFCSEWNLQARQFLCYFSALGGTAALAGASHEAGDLPRDLAKATSERTSETLQTTASAALH